MDGLSVNKIVMTFEPGTGPAADPAFQPNVDGITATPAEEIAEEAEATIVAEEVADEEVADDAEIEVVTTDTDAPEAIVEEEVEPTEDAE